MYLRVTLRLTLVPLLVPCRMDIGGVLCSARLNGTPLDKAIHEVCHRHGLLARGLQPQHLRQWDTFATTPLIVQPAGQGTLAAGLHPESTRVSADLQSRARDRLHLV